MAPHSQPPSNPDVPLARPPFGLAQLNAAGRVRMIRPAYFTEADYPWLRGLLDERDRFVTRRRREWRERVSERLPIDAPRSKLLTALRVLDRLSHDQTSSGISPRKLREVVFHAAACASSRDEALSQSARVLGMAAPEIEAALFADMPDERLLMPLTEATEPDRLALLGNQEIIASLLARALRVRIVARGQVRAVVRHAKLMGLLCNASPGQTKDDITLEISGPFALFRHTRIYARALASLIPRLSWCHKFRLEADCVLGTGTHIGCLELRTGDPVIPARELTPFDSKVEERFAKSFGKLAPEWDVVREPRAVPVDDALIFPDFELRHRATGDSWLLEIAGYWTPDYIHKKLAALRRANLPKLIVAIDEERACADEALGFDAQLLRFRRKVDPRAVLAIIDPTAAKALRPEAKRTRKRLGPKTTSGRTQTRSVR